ncbi:MAG: hypothetical protein WD397_08985 [Wenzhouxiangellaceae bacterium]
MFGDIAISTAPAEHSSKVQVRLFRFWRPRPRDPHPARISIPPKANLKRGWATASRPGGSGFIEQSGEFLARNCAIGGVLSQAESTRIDLIGCFAIRRA